VTRTRSPDNAEDLLARIAEATAPLTGDDFFRALVGNLAQALSFREVFVTECIGPRPARVRILCRWFAGRFAENVEYELAGTPCERTVRERRTTFIGEAVEALYPQWAGEEAYLGVPIFDARGDAVIGHLAFYDDRPRDEPVAALPVFRILAARAGAELLRRRAEAALRDSESKYRLIVENQTDLVLTLDAEGRCRFVSPSVCRALGAREDALVGAPVETFVDPRDRDAFAAARTAARLAPFRAQAEVRMLAPEPPRWVAWMFTGGADGAASASAVIAAGRDVTDRRLAEERARQHVETLAHLARVVATGGMAGAIAHEVNQPLTAVIAYAQACIRLLRSGEAAVPEAIEWMERAVAQAEAAADVLQGLRSFVRRQEMRREAVSVHRIAADVVELMRARAAEAHATVVTDVPARLPAVSADPVQLRQVLLNLVGNALDAVASTDGDGGSVRIAGGVDEAGAVALWVEDDGPGFDPATEARLFEPFFTTKPEGMGIGLSVSRAIVEAHGGRLIAERRDGGGARFRVVLQAL
jgi:PAS domain S-box-containing protein